MSQNLVSMWLSAKNNYCRGLTKGFYHCDRAVGGLLNDKYPFVCGGRHKHADECIIVGQLGIKKSQLLEGRCYAASLVLNQSHIWITGGFDDTDDNTDCLNSTELVSVYVLMYRTLWA
jgi:hypothetical protein